MTNLYHPYQLNSPFPILGVFIGIFYLNFLQFFKEYSLGNSEDFDQTPHYAASDQGLHCLDSPFKGMLCLYGLSIWWYKDNALMFC